MYTVASNNEHHISKKKRYTVVFLPEEDARASKTFRFRPWQVFAIAIFTILLFFGMFWLMIVYTPMGQIFPITSPGLRNQYTQQLVELHQRLSGMMEELMVLRSYNAKLRKALGEGTLPSDSALFQQAEEKRTADSKVYGVLPENTSGAPLSAGEELQPVVMKEAVRYIERQYQFPAIFPAQGYITRGFDPAINHIGIDIAGKTGSLVYAAADGVVVFSGWTYNDGYVIILSHADGFMTFYKHNETLLKSAGTHVRRGESIALLGNSGETSQGPHLHFEIWKDGIPVDPAMLIMNYTL